MHLITQKFYLLPDVTFLRLCVFITQNLRPYSKFSKCDRLVLTFFFDLAKNRDFVRPFVACKWHQKLVVFQLFYSVFLAVARVDQLPLWNIVYVYKLYTQFIVRTEIYWLGWFTFSTISTPFLTEVTLRLYLPTLPSTLKSYVWLTISNKAWSMTTGWGGINLGLPQVKLSLQPLLPPQIKSIPSLTINILSYL